MKRIFTIALTLSLFAVIAGCSNDSPVVPTLPPGAAGGNDDIELMDNDLNDETPAIVLAEALLDESGSVEFIDATSGSESAPTSSACPSRPRAWFIASLMIYPSVLPCGLPIRP